MEHKIRINYITQSENIPRQQVMGLSIYGDVFLNFEMKFYSPLGRTNVCLINFNDITSISPLCTAFLKGAIIDPLLSNMQITLVNNLKVNCLFCIFHSPKGEEGV